MRARQFYSYLSERENIRIRREQGMKFPWTRDKILREYKFTNVKRLHDRTTQFLKNYFYDKEGQEPETRRLILLNCALFRYFGTWEFARDVHWQRGFKPEYIKKVARRRMDTGERVFTGSYMITNCHIKAPKIDVVVDYFLTDLWKKSKDIIGVAVGTASWEKTSEALRNVHGFGGTGFMGKELIMDTMLCNFWPTPDRLPIDYWTWSPLGPGSRRGIKRVTDRKDDPSDPVEFIRELAGKQKEFYQHYAADPLQRLSPHDVQFGLCEFDKYERARLSEGRPRNKYHHRKGD